jgi:hypothetical protein
MTCGAAARSSDPVHNGQIIAGIWKWRHIDHFGVSQVLAKQYHDSHGSTD